jgi:hypothetical protein
MTEANAKLIVVLGITGVQVLYLTFSDSTPTLLLIT